jgi:hypothetical protein
LPKLSLLSFLMLKGALLKKLSLTLINPFQKWETVGFTLEIIFYYGGIYYLVTLEPFAE